MRITGLALVPPPTAADLPKVTPELLASVLARYSRSNDGLAAILEKVDLANPDASIDRILKFVDYGHASIGGLTGGLAVALDGISMWLACCLAITRSARLPSAITPRSSWPSARAGFVEISAQASANERLLLITRRQAACAMAG